MIIKSFSIDRFGVFAGQAVEELSPGLNIFLGGNEAGKSTLLSFFRAMFFGYQRSGRNRFDYPAFGGAAALSGGSLILSSARGEDLRLIRRPGRHGGEAQLAGPGGSVLPAGFLSGLLSGYTDKMYDQVFCFGYSDLAGLAGMNDRDVAGALHAAAFGTGFKSPLDVSKTLLESQKKIFTPRAASTPVYKIFKQLSETRAGLTRLGSELAHYNRLKEERAALGAEQADLEAGARLLSFALARAQSLAEAWPEWSGLRDVRAALALNPHPGGEFSVESIERFDEITGNLEAVLAGCREKDELLKSGREAMERLADFAVLAGIWPDCQNLQSRRVSLQKSLAALPGRADALKSAQERRLGMSQGLGAGWNLERILNFEISLSVQEGVELGRQNLASAERAVEQACAEAVRLDNEAREAFAEAVAVRRSFGQGGADAAPDALYSPEARARFEACGREFDASRRDADECRGRVLDLEAEEAELSGGLKANRAGLDGCREAVALAASEARAALRPPLFGLATARADARRIPWLLLCLALAALCFYGAYAYFEASPSGQTGWRKFADLQAWKTYLSFDWLRFGLGLLFIWGGCYWLAPRVATLGLWRPEDISDQFVSPAEREAMSRADALAGQILAQEARLGRVVSALESARVAALAAERAASDAAGLWRAEAGLYAIETGCRPEAALRIFDAHALAALAAKRARFAASGSEAARSGLKGAWQSWQRWLAGQGLDSAFTPEAARLALQRIQQVKEQSSLVLDRAAELQAGRDEVEAFAVELEALYARSGLRSGLDASADGLLPRFEALYKASFGAHEEVLRLKERERELEKLAAELFSLKELAKSRAGRLAGILEQGGAADEDDYRLRFKRQAAHMELRGEEERLLSRLEQAAGQTHGSGRALWAGREEFLQVLGSSMLADLEDRGVGLRAELAAVETALAEKYRRQGEIKAQLDNLESGRSSVELQAAEAALQDSLKTLARDWGLAALAGYFIGQARRSFEEERHDSVIRQAGEILSSLTGARYRQMLFDLGGKDGKAYAVAAGGARLDSEAALSQGTREQLYLALRLAFIRQHNLTKESLPLIMDDILVNFDPARARKAAEIFTAFSADNQILFFTCHPQTAGLLRELAPDAACFNLQDGNIGLGLNLKKS